MVQAEAFPALEPIGVGFDQAGTPAIVSLPIRLQFLELDYRLSARWIANFMQDRNLGHTRLGQRPETGLKIR